MSSGVTRGRRTDAVANHARILAAARASLTESGLNMEITEVAERAGVGVGTLYRHFANRDELVLAVLTQLFEEVHARVLAAAELADPLEALRYIPYSLTACQSLFAVLQDPRAARITHEVKARMHGASSMTEEILAVVEGIIARGVQAGVFRADLDTQVTALAVLGTIGAVVETLSSTRSLDDLAALLADLLTTMVGAR